MFRRGDRGLNPKGQIDVAFQNRFVNFPLGVRVLIESASKNVAVLSVIVVLKNAIPRSVSKGMLFLLNGV